MKFRELLTSERVVAPLGAADLAEALQRLVPRMGEALGGERGQRLARDLAAGATGDVVRAGSDAVIVAAQTDAVDGLTAGLGAQPEPLVVSPPESDRSETARVVVLLFTPRSPSTVRDQIVPALGRLLRDPHRVERLARAGSADEVLRVDELVELDVYERLLVEDALVPLRYRVYPDTPLSEVVGLMVRRGVQAVPVVGDSLELVGIVSVGDALQQLLPATRAAEEGERGAPDFGNIAARDVMTRSVLCVSEDQSLLDAGSMMVNRDVEQLPVVRDGELVGFVTREAVLRHLVEINGLDGEGEPAVEG
ncbi:MAG: CBS domain-containing protein [Gemmatimonadetes bacterium]|nr:MAG: CBS domain-containing protein [Gemmatimonadota bacterium]